METRISPPLTRSSHMRLPPPLQQSSISPKLYDSRPPCDLHRAPELPIPLTKHYLLAQPPSVGQLFPPGLTREAQRLNDQHYAYVRASNGHLLHPSIDLLARHHFRRILDVGCGTGIWLRDFAASSQLPPGQQLEAHGCDVDLRMIRTLPVNPRGFISFQHDITRAISAAGTRDSHDVATPESYDMVHARLLIFALEKGQRGWQAAVNNMTTFLKPQGVLHLSDLNAVAQPYRATPCEPSHSIEALNRISQRALSFINHDVHAGDHLESYLAGAGLHHITSERFRIPFGKAAKDQGWSDEDVARADQTALRAFVGLRVPFLAAGGDDALPGIITAEDFDQFLSELAEEIREKGMLMEFVMAYGRKPGH